MKAASRGESFGITVGVNLPPAVGGEFASAGPVPLSIDYDRDQTATDQTHTAAVVVRGTTGCGEVGASTAIIGAHVSGIQVRYALG